VLRRKPEDPFRKRFIEDCRAFDLVSKPGPRRALAYLDDKGGGEGIALAPSRSEDWFVWRYIALLALTGRGDRLKGWSLGPAEGVAKCRYGTIPNFTAKKATEPAS